MNIISTAKMGPGTFEAKFIPLSQLNSVKRIFVLRETEGPDIPKVTYIQYPVLLRKLKFFKAFLPIILTYYTFKTKSNYILAYHVFPHAIYGYIASLFSGRQLIIGQTGLDIQKIAAKSKISKKFYKTIINRANKFNVPGQNSKLFWEDFGIDINKINILHSTIDTDFYKPTPKVLKEYDFIFLGRLDPVKQIDKIILAFKEFKEKLGKTFNHKLIIVGDGPLRGDLEALVGKLKLRDYIIFSGFVSNPKDIINKSKFLVMSSVSEGLPTAMMQAMACEVVPISNLVGNIGDILIDKKTGFIHNGEIKELSELFVNTIDISDANYHIVKTDARKIIIDGHSHLCARIKWDKILT